MSSHAEPNSTAEVESSMIIEDKATPELQEEKGVVDTGDSSTSTTKKQSKIKKAVQGTTSVSNTMFLQTYFSVSS